MSKRITRLAATAAIAAAVSVVPMAGTAFAGGGGGGYGHECCGHRGYGHHENRNFQSSRNWNENRNFNDNRNWEHRRFDLDNRRWFDNSRESGFHPFQDFGAMAGFGVFGNDFSFRPFSNIVIA